jgi:Fe-S cluster assembly iron-binding protein IscA
MTKARNIADLGSNDVLDTTASGVGVTGEVASDTLTINGGTNFTAPIEFMGNDTNWAVAVQNGTTTGASYGLVVRAGTNTNDISFETRDADNNKSFRVLGNGDITMYKDDGTTSGFEFDASTANVTVNGDIKLTETGNTAQSLTFQQVGGASFIKPKSGSNDGELYISGGQTATNRMKITTGGDIIFYEDDGTTRGVTYDASTGRVGIGSVFENEVIDSTLHIAGITPEIRIEDVNNGVGGTSYTPKLVFDANGDEVGSISYGSADLKIFTEAYNSSAIVLGTSGSEQVRLDSDGNFLVGKVSSGSSIRGSELRDGTAGFVATFKTDSDGICIDRSATADNGEFIRLRLNGSTVGLVSVNSNDNINIGATTGGGAGLQFWGAGGTTPNIGPLKEMGASDNEVDFGRSSERFNDIFLGGGVRFDGGATANYLDDYEEGENFTLYEPNGQAPNMVTNRSNYTKIGNLVYFRASISVGSTSNPNPLNTNLPFASANNSYYAGGGYVTFTDLGSTYQDNIRVNIENSGANTLFTYGSGSSLTCAQASGARIDFIVIYRST